MSKVAEIEAALPTLSPDELGRLEATLRRLRCQSDVDVRWDGRSWPSTPEEVAAQLAELDGLAPLLTKEEAERFDAWRAAERERQRALLEGDEDRVRTLFS